MSKELKFNLKIGDKVTPNEECEAIFGTDPYMRVGKVVGIDNRGDFIVDFRSENSDRPPYDLHDCDGYFNGNYGWYIWQGNYDQFDKVILEEIYENKKEDIEEKEIDSKFKVGDKVVTLTNSTWWKANEIGTIIEWELVNGILLFGVLTKESLVVRWVVEEDIKLLSQKEKNEPEPEVIAQEIANYLLLYIAQALKDILE